MPAFYLNKTNSLDDYGVIFALGYRINASSLTQGRRIVRTQARDGTILDTQTIVPPNSGCTQEYTILADVGTARDFAKGQDNKLLAAYYGDTWGNLWRYTLVNGVSRVGENGNFGCEQPLHFASTVVQLDRDNPLNNARQIYVVQVTNSALDPDTQAFDPSQMVILRDLADGTGNVVSDTTFGNSGQITFDVDDEDEMCGVVDESDGSCAVPLPATARPAGTPLAILKKDGMGFQLLSIWYSPSPDGCGLGESFFAIHEWTVATGMTQKQGFKVGNEPVPPPAVVGGKIFVVTGDGAVNLQGEISSTYVGGGTQGGTGSSPYFRALGWNEIE